MEGTDNVKKASAKERVLTLDDKIADVLKYDNDGVVLRFDTTPGKFRKLPPEVWKELSAVNKQTYIMCEQTAKIEEQYANDDAWKDLIEIGGNLGLATDRLKLSGTDDEHFDYYLARPDKMRSHAAKGYVKADDVCFADGSNTIKNLGQTELVAMKIPKAKAARNKALKQERKEHMMGAVDRKQGTHIVEKDRGETSITNR